MKINRLKIMIIIVFQISMTPEGIFANINYNSGWSALSLDLNLITDSADIIIEGWLVSVPPPDDILGKDFYRIISRTSVFGSVATNGLLVVVTNVDSMEGMAAKVEENEPYMLFLKEIKSDSESTEEIFVAYHLVENWKGIIALRKTASEKRAVRSIKKQYGIVVTDMPQDLVNAVRMSVDDGVKVKGSVSTKYSEGARNLCRTLELTNSKKKKNGTTVAEKSPEKGMRRKVTPGWEPSTKPRGTPGVNEEDGNDWEN